MLAGLSACAQLEPQPVDVPKEEQTKEDKPEVDLHKYDKLELDMSAWKYDVENDVYYQLGVPYCLEPASESYESLAIFVPGAYLTADEDEKKPVYTVNAKATVGAYTPKTAPVVMPVNSGDLGPQTSPTSYSFAGLGRYLSAGLVYVYAGFRGRSSGYESAGDGIYSGGDPWPLVDLKAAVRFLRYNAEVLPCDTSRVFTFGFSAGGGVSALMGCSGDSELYAPYLEEIGAATYDAEGTPLSDATFGSASWCPLTSFDTADASYEWMLGQYFEEGTRAQGTWTKLLSNDLAVAYADYVNQMDLRDADDQPLELEETAGDLFAAGSYYGYLVDLVQDAASTFFANTQFPYTYTPQHLVNASFPGDPNLQSVGAGTQDVEAVTGDPSAQAAGVGASDVAADGKISVQSVIYNKDTDYVNDLNSDAWWFTYNKRRALVQISSLGAFVQHLKKAAKGVGAFDSPERSTIENQLFGVDDVGSLHFSQMVSDQLVAHREAYAAGDGWDDKYVQEWTGDLTEVDSLQTDMQTRMDMFNPLYFVSGHYDGFGTAAVAPYWRVNTGLFQTDTALCTEANLVLALRQYEGVKDVRFYPVWGQGHVLAEVTGSAENNLIDWICDCCGK
jgi:acetyl esterase/lipase